MNPLPKQSPALVQGHPFQTKSFIVTLIAKLDDNPHTHLAMNTIKSDHLFTTCWVYFTNSTRYFARKIKLTQLQTNAPICSAD